MAGQAAIFDSWTEIIKQFWMSVSLRYLISSFGSIRHSLGGYVVWRISRWAPWRPTWISERNYFSNSESVCRSDASHQVSAQSGLWFGRRCRLKNFKHGGHLGYRNGTILAILNFCTTMNRPIKFRFNLTYGLGDVVWRISNWRPSWISERKDFSNSGSPCYHNASH